MFITVYRPNYRRICLCNEAKYQSYQSKERYRSHGPAQLRNGAIEGKKVGACLLLLGGGLLLLRGGLLLLREFVGQLVGREWLLPHSAGRQCPCNREQAD